MSEGSESPITPEEELNEEEIFDDPSKLNLSERKQKKVLLKYIQEKRELQEQLEAREKSIQEYKAKVYDLQQEMAAVKKNTARAPPLVRNRKKIVPLLITQPSAKERYDTILLYILMFMKSFFFEQANRLSNVGNRSPALNRTGIVRPSTKKTSRTKMKKKSSGISKAVGKLEKQDSVNSATPEPVDIGEIESAVKTLERYKDYSSRFPELKLAVIMHAEKTFFEADINHDGTIDEEELEKLLEKQGQYMTTKKEVKEIMKEIDKDETGTIDLMEYMAVMERVQQRKRTNLPPQLTKSTVCAIQ